MSSEKLYSEKNWFYHPTEKDPPTYIRLLEVAAIYETQVPTYFTNNDGSFLRKPTTTCVITKQINVLFKGIDDPLIIDNCSMEQFTEDANWGLCDTWEKFDEMRKRMLELKKEEKKNAQ